MSRRFGEAYDAPAELYEGPHWFACRTRGRAEKKVAARLEDAGVEAFLPLVPREREWSDRTAVVELPVFPGYVFARFALGERVTVLSTHGVAGILSPNGYPTPVRDHEIEALRRLVEGILETGEAPEPEDYLEPGEPVVVVRGPFKGMEGVFLERRGRGRVAVRVDALRQAASVEVDRDGVEPAAGRGFRNARG